MPVNEVKTQIVGSNLGSIEIPEDGLYNVIFRFQGRAAEDTVAWMMYMMGKWGLDPITREIFYEKIGTEHFCFKINGGEFAVTEAGCAFGSWGSQFKKGDLVSWSAQLDYEPDPEGPISVIVLDRIG